MHLWAMRASGLFGRDRRDIAIEAKKLPVNRHRNGVRHPLVDKFPGTSVHMTFSATIRTSRMPDVDIALGHGFGGGHRFTADQLNTGDDADSIPNRTLRTGDFDDDTGNPLARQASSPLAASQSRHFSMIRERSPCCVRQPSPVGIGNYMLGR